MTSPGDEPYGFEYDHDGKSFVFHIVASTREEAEARLQSMAAATCRGRLCPTSPFVLSEPERTPAGEGTSTS